MHTYWQGFFCSAERALEQVDPGTTYQNETGRRASSRLRSIMEVDESAAHELMGKCNRKAAQMVTYRIIHNIYIYILYIYYIYYIYIYIYILYIYDI